MIPQTEYVKRREKLMASFEDTKGAIYLYGGPPVEEGIRFIPSAFFRYLTGIDIPDVSVLLIPKERKTILFAPERTVLESVWGGWNLPRGELKERFGADQVLGTDKVRKVVSKFRGRLHSLPGCSKPFARYSHSRLRSDLLEARLRKSTAEVREIEKSVSLVAEAIIEALKATAESKRENEIAALIKYVYERNGGRCSFPPIATTTGAILHETWNQRVLERNRLLLVDTGATFEYASDISRTWPVKGTFTGEQKAVYEIVLRAKNESTTMIRGGVKFRDVHFAAAKIIAEGLRQEGILKGELDGILENGAYRLFFPHGLGHTFGLAGDAKDIHGGKTSLAKGMPAGYVVTVEPGIYFNAFLDAPEVYGKHKDFIRMGKARKLKKSISGIRLEDDVVVTKKGYRVLGPPIPETVEEIEALLSSR
ncbi:MAG: aminopeptidase P family protein [Planctomycetota bacterium]|jgi:Xaa-Pro aminopeptidase